MSAITNTSAMFSGAFVFNQDIGDWDVSSVRDMSYMFTRTNAFNGDIGRWDVSSVRDMSYMFYYTRSFNQDIGDWDVSSVTDMSAMFYQAYAFDQDISGWDISSVTDMSAMFSSISLSTPNYDALLIGWSAQDVQPNVNFDAGNSIYSSAAADARRILTSPPNNWTITDGGPQ